MIRDLLKGAALAAVAVSINACTSLPSNISPVDMDAAAVTSLRAMSNKLAGANSIQFRSNNSYDAAIAERIGSPRSASIQVSVKRPNQLHGHLAGEGGAYQNIFLDGKNLTIHDGRVNLYATAEINRPTIDKALDAIAEFYGFSPPLADFVVSNPFDGMTRKMQSGRHLGKETIGTDECEHLAFSGEKIDWELWISTSDQLPRRYIITVKSLQGNPRFTANFQLWSLNMGLPDTLFAFQPPQGAERIEMIKVTDPAPQPRIAPPPESAPSLATIPAPTPAPEPKPAPAPAPVAATTAAAKPAASAAKPSAKPSLPKIQAQPGPFRMPASHRRN